MAIQAAKKAIENAGITPDQIGLIIVATVTPDRAFPSVACQVKENLGIQCAAMDISAACSGFIYGLATAKQFVESE